MSADAVAFRWKDYRHHGKEKVMVLDADEFIRRFLLHTLPDGFHRIRHYGFLANSRRTAKLTLCRQLLAARPVTHPATAQPPENDRTKERHRRLRPLPLLRRRGGLGGSPPAALAVPPA